MAAIQRAVAGATRTTSAVSAATMCPMRRSGSSSSGSSIDGAAPQRLERQRADERAARVGHQHLDLGARGDQRATSSAAL